ncbi:MAG: multicopper oxidase family protein [Gemmatimonadota bacterium]
MPPRLLSGILLCTLVSTGSAQTVESEPAARAYSPRCAPPLATAIYCMELLPTARAEDAGAIVELGRAASPFQVAVTPAGHLTYELTAWIEGLPDPAELGPYTTYVAWVTPMALDPVLRLGPVSNGENALGRVSLNKFLLMISAEASASVTERQGPLILRGRSPSTRIEAHDMLAQAPSAAQAPRQAAAADTGAHAGHAMAHEHAAAPGADTPSWSPPPMYPGLAMLPGVMAVQPRVDPLRVLPAGIDPATLPEVRPAQLVELPDGGTLDLEAGFVRRRLGQQQLVMLAFNGQQPGPLLRVRQAATIFVNFTNGTPFPTAVHWHGLRLDNRFDGVPGVTQDAVPPGGSFRYQVHFPDPGIYWYHPHHREDVQQELGLYGNMLVDALEPAYYGPANREEVLILDDLLLGEDGIPPFGAQAATHALMGRFGNQLLVNGEPAWELEVARGEVVRFFLTNASNTRTFNLSFTRTAEADAAAQREARMEVMGDVAYETLPLKLVASDVGRFEREERVQSVVLAPAERYVVEARFPEAGRWVLRNRVQAIDHRQGVYFPEERTLGEVRVTPAAATDDHAHAHEELRTHADVVADIDRYRHRFEDPPDHHLELDLQADSLARPVRESMLYDRVYANPVEWAGTMPHMNWASTAREVEWILRDADSGRENMAIDWRFRVGDVVRIRVVNRRDVFHAMQHPLHFHGQRFLVLSQNGAPTQNLVWKDTVLLPAGSTTELLLELSNPGRWMVHCHIAEHLEAGMKFVLDVEER